MENRRHRDLSHGENREIPSSRRDIVPFSFYGSGDISAVPIQVDEANLIWTPATAMPPSPTAAAHRLTDPERTSPAAKIPGRLVSRGAGRRLFSRHAGASATSAPVLMNPFSSLSISDGNHSVHGRAPIMEKTAGVRTTLRSPVLVFSRSLC